MNPSDIIINKTDLLKCNECNTKFDTARLCMSHVNKVHNMSKRCYIIKHYFNGVVPTCACGCGTELAFKPTKTGPFFKQYTKNHAPKKPHTDATKDKIRKSIRTTLQSNYGVDNIMEIDLYRNKIKDTKFDRYGNANYNNSEQNLKTKLGVHGDANYNNAAKIIETNLIKYGAHSYTATPNGIRAIKQTKLDRYGDENYNNMVKHKQTNQSKYGVDYYQQTDEYRQQIGQSVIHKFIAMSDELKIKPLFTLDDYEGVSSKKYLFKCTECTTDFSASIDNGNIPICPICYTTTRSSAQVELHEFIKSVYDGDVIINSRSVISPKEVDIYLPSMSLAIEYNGLYWHSERSGRTDKAYHLSKTISCDAVGVNLLHVFENEWLYKKNIVKSIIQSYIGGYSARIHGRKCTILQITHSESASFLDENHLQGHDQASVQLGLYYLDELVSVMSFVKSRYSKSYQWEISRYCNKLNTSVVGGASKLLKFFERMFNPTSMVTFSDRRYFQGEVYRSLGFEFVNYTKPSYMYFKSNDYLHMYNRVTFQKHKLEKKLDIFNANLTEWENMQVNGYDRIWDCGTSKWVKCYEKLPQ